MSKELLGNEVFRFVTLRSPQALTQQKRVERFIRYVADETQEGFYARLLELKNSTESNDNEKLRLMQTAAATYLKSDLAFLSIEKLSVYIPNISTLTEQLAAEGRKVAARTLLTLWEIVGISKDELRLQIWDTLIAANILGGHLYAGEHLTTALRVLHALDGISEETPESQLINRLHAHILLPNTLFPLPKISAEFPTLPEPNVPVNKDPNKEKREKYEAALQEVRKYRNRKWILQGRKRETPQGENNTTYEDIDDLLAENVNAFSNETQNVFTDLMLSYPINMLSLIELLLMEIQSLQPKFGVAGRRVISVGGAIWEENPNPQYRETGIPNDLAIPRFRPIGVADLRIVEQEICCYKPGEIAHTEPVLRGESKERSTRRLDKVESFESSTIETSKEEERDSQSTDRYELESESSKVANKDLSISAGMNLTASYGPVSLGVNSSFAFNSSTQVSNSESVNIGREVTQKAVKRISEKVKTEKTTKTTFEFEELNVHKLENKGEGNVTGIYRWLDKFYKCRVRNLGKRTMYEFLVPRPAAFHIEAMSSQEAQSVSGILQPIDPRSDAFNTEYGHQLLNIDSVTENNYTVWAALMGIEIAAPPKFGMNICYGISGQDLPVKYKDTATDDILIKKSASTSTEIVTPEGYNPMRAWIDAQIYNPIVNGDGHVTVTIGNVGHFIISSGPHPNPIILWNYEQGQALYVNVIGLFSTYTIGLNIEFERLDSYYKAWQMKVYNQIIATYEQKKAQYEMAIKAAKTRGGVEIKGTNPNMNREIEQTELKKWCMMHLFPVGSVPNHPYDPEFSSWAMQLWSNLTPFFFSQDATNDGQRVLFAEGMFEWDNMIYQFFPYYWSPEHHWKEIYSYQDTDPLFQKFMQAGYARVVVPVKPGYEAKVASFFSTGIVPQSSTLVYDEETLAALLEDMQDIPDPNATDNIENFTWEVKIPTSLVVLQKGSGCVGDEGLPCYCDQVFTDTPPEPKPFEHYELVPPIESDGETDNTTTT